MKYGQSSCFGRTKSKLLRYGYRVIADCWAAGLLAAETGLSATTIPFTPCSDSVQITSSGRSAAVTQHVDNWGRDSVSSSVLGRSSNLGREHNGGREDFVSSGV